MCAVVSVCEQRSALNQHYENILIQLCWLGLGMGPRNHVMSGLTKMEIPACAHNKALFLLDPELPGADHIKTVLTWFSSKLMLDETIAAPRV